MSPFNQRLSYNTQSHTNASDQPNKELPFEIHIGNLDQLWADTTRATTPSHLVVTPTDLHQRNLEARLRSQQQPHSNFTFRRIGELAGDVTSTHTAISTALDRVDRLMLIDDVLSEADTAVYENLGASLGTPLGQHIERLERTRSELELVTGFHPRRMEAFAAALEDHSKPTATETLDILAGVSHLHRDLQQRLSSSSTQFSTQAVSKTSLLCRAVRLLQTESQSDESPWKQAYPDIETLSVTATSMFTAPVADLCRLLSQTTDVDVHVHLRAATGPQIHQQLPAETTVETPGLQGVFEWR